MNLEELGLLGVFIAGAIPWFEAIGVVPGGILIGLNPLATVIAAAAGNLITIVVFSYAGSRIRQWALERREKKGREPRSDRWAKAERSFDKYGIFGMAVLGPIIIGTQFAAAVSVAAGVKPLRVSIIIGISMIIWAVLFAFLSIWLIGVGGFDTWLGQND